MSKEIDVDLTLFEMYTKDQSKASCIQCCIMACELLVNPLRKELPYVKN